MPVYANAIRKGCAAALQADGKTLHGALVRYYEDNSSFPADNELNLTTLSPRTDGYINPGEAIISKLVGGQLMVYVAPDVDGADQQFVAVLRHANDPAVMVAIVHTNLVTDDGRWGDGSYVIDTMEVGSMLYATVAGGSWEKMDKAGRIHGRRQTGRGLRRARDPDRSRVE